MTSRVTLSPNDAMWLNMDTPENLMIIESILWFDEPLDRDAVVETLQTRMVGRYPVFSWRPELAEGAIGFDHWIADPEFDIRNHVTVHDVGSASGHDAIKAFLETKMSEPLPRDRPLWHAHILAGEDVSAVMLRYHHAIADGTALVRVLLDMTTDTPHGDSTDVIAEETEPAEEPAVAEESHHLGNDPDNHPIATVPTPPERPHAGTLTRAAGALAGIVTWPLHAGAAVTNSAVGLVRALDPEHQSSLTWKLTDQARGAADAVDKLLVGTHPDALPFGRPGLAKSADWCPPYPVADIKRVARAQGATLNDVMMAVLSGALRRYVIARGEVPQDVVTMIPVNLRPWDAPLPEHLGNKFALVAYELPMGQPTVASRLEKAKERMDVIKQGPEALVTFGLAHAIGSLGAVTGTVSRQMISFFGNKAFGVTTNVPGPTSTRWFAGREMVGMLGWVPGASNQTLGICIFSYNGNVRVGFKADATVIPDVANLVAAFDDEMADLLAELEPAE